MARPGSKEMKSGQRQLRMEPHRAKRSRQDRAEVAVELCKGRSQQGVSRSQRVL